MINWLITMFTEWLMEICYFHSFSNTNIGNPYNVLRLDIFLFLSFNMIYASSYSFELCLPVNTHLHVYLFDRRAKN